jgi:hypothetical protein
LQRAPGAGLQKETNFSTLIVGLATCVVGIGKIPFSKTAKYLGITLDDKLSWRPKIENKIKKAKRTLMAIRSVIGKLWGPSPECAKWSWTGVIRPALTYGAIVWSRTASQSWAKIKLQRLQRMALSQIAHVRPSTPSAALEIM